MCGERAGTRTQDLQIKSNFGRAKNAKETKPPVSREREIIRRIATFGDPGLETIGRDIRMRWNAQRLQSLFTRKDDGWRARDCVTVGHPLFRADGLKVTWTRLPLAACKQALQSRGTAGQARESREHMIMKRAAVLWMLHEGAKDASEEVYCLVGRADACSVKRNWIAECGKTGVSKLVTVVESGHPIRFSLIPFQDLTKRDGEARRLIAVEFSWTPALTAALEAETYASAERTRDAMDRAWARMIGEPGFSRSDGRAGA